MLRHFLELVPRASVRQEERMRNSPANVFSPDGEPHVVCDLSSMHISAPRFLPPPFALGAEWSRVTWQEPPITRHRSLATFHTTPIRTTTLAREVPR